MININELLLLNFINNKNYQIIDFCYVCIGLLFVHFIKNNYINIILKFLPDIYFKKSTINITGWEFLQTGQYTFEYPRNMIAINNYVYVNNKAKNYNYFNIMMNGIKYFEKLKENINVNDNYLLDEINNICIYEDIYLTIDKEKINLSNEVTKSFIWKISMKLISYKNDNKYIENFINKCIDDYENIYINKNKDKIYHFIYQGTENGNPNFSSTIISNLNNPNYKNYESFDNLFHKHKNMLIKDINRLKDIEYYKKTGLKRKKGYLFYGPPGCGKTSTVMAISNYDNRHILEIPLSRIKTNNEFEKILNICEIDNIKINYNNTIILFDELDIGIALNRTQNENNVMDIDINIMKQINFNNDKLSLNTVLSRLDGIGNYNGLIIIGTTNNIDNLDKSLYRDGRLNLLKFDYVSKNEIIDMIEKYYDIKLKQEQIDKLDNIDNISHSKLIFEFEKYENVDDLLLLFKN